MPLTCSVENRVERKPEGSEEAADCTVSVEWPALGGQTGDMFCLTKGRPGVTLGPPCDAALDTKVSKTVLGRLQAPGSQGLVERGTRGN